MTAIRRVPRVAREFDRPVDDRLGALPALKPEGDATPIDG
jgi:hypothetical protein